ncbi:MAG TPA: hypothetical protein VJ969_09425 [Desulfopila sp.]|nr:hypothetical protein [Desulfopila sp.]
MTSDDEKKDLPPQIGPYVFPVILAALGVWCFYDGWITSDIDMQEHQLFNRVASIVLLGWAAIDFYRTQKAEKKSKKSE